MISRSAEVISVGAEDIVIWARERGVELWIEKGELHYKAPRGAVSEEEVQRLRIHRTTLIQLLQRATSIEEFGAARGRSRDVYRAPLSFSQLAHWNLYRLTELPSFSLVQSANRLHGLLNVEAFKKSVAEVICRHEALRTSIVISDGVPVQEISASVVCEIEVDDLTACPEESREIELRRLIEKYTFSPVVVLVDTLFRVRLIRLGSNDHVLVIAMEHLISDAVSVSIMLREIFTAYAQAERGEPFYLPRIPVQFPEYAIWQRRTQGSRVEKHEVYWSEHLKECRRLKFPVDPCLGDATQGGWGLAPFKINRKLKDELHEWCRRRRTTLVMSVLTAYVGLVLRWCNVSDAVVLYETDGRVRQGVENTIGYFAFPLYLRVKVEAGDSCVDLLTRVINEYCGAYEHADLCFFEAQVPRPEFTRNTCFNWVPYRSVDESCYMQESAGSITYTQIPFDWQIVKEVVRDTEPIVGLVETDDGIHGWVQFPLNRFSFNTMERFGRNFLLFIEELLKSPERLIREIDLL